VGILLHHLGELLAWPPSREAAKFTHESRYRDDKAPRLEGLFKPDANSVFTRRSNWRL